MLIFELVVGLLLVGALLALWADRLGVPYPSLLALAGALLALVPGTPVLDLDPELALALFVAPVLLDAAYDASPRDLRANLVPVSGLALAAVVLTIAAVALVSRQLLPGMSWAAALTLGAIVAPPDASAATAVLRRLRLPHRVAVILEGESLFNDATALLVYRIAVAAALAPVVSGWHVVSTLLLTSVGGVLAGVLLARLYLWATLRVTDIPIFVLLQFVGTFAVWLLADRLGLSTIITVVTYAMTIARRAPARTDARHRIASYAVWDVAVFVLNVLAFVLIGLQLRGILGRTQGPALRDYALFAAAVCGSVVVVRLLWVMAHNSVARWHRGRHGERSARPPIGTALVISWCGMRGIVSLATALALPDGSRGVAFPHRDLIVLSAFAVVLSTLVLQGLTLRFWVEWLGLERDDSVEREVRLARIETARAALRALAEATPDTPAVEILRAEYEARIQAADTPVPNGVAPPSLTLSDLQRRAVDAQRQALTDLRARSLIGDDAFHVAEEELDLIELTADSRVRPDLQARAPAP
jgi:monovalent cation/hydrogen antiporter